MGTIAEYGIILLLVYIIVNSRNDIFYYNEETEKIEYRFKDLLSSIGIWFVLFGVVIWIIGQ